MAILNELKARLGLDTSQFSKGVREAGADAARMGQRIQSGLAPGVAAMRGLGRVSNGLSNDLHIAAGKSLTFGSNFIKGLAVGAVSAVLAETAGGIRSVIGELADLQDSADRIDMGVEDYQALRFGMKLAGVGTDEFSKSLEKFNENIGDAARGATPFGAFLARSGIQIKDAAGNIRPTNDLLKEFADLVQRAPEGERISMLSDAFGKVGKSMVLAMRDGRAGIEDMMAKAVESGAVLDKDVIAKAAELDDKFDLLTTRVGNFFKTAIVGASDGVTALVSYSDSIDALLADEGRARIVLGNALYEQIAQTKNISDEAVIASEQVVAGMAQVVPAAEAMASTFEQIAQNMRESNPQLAADLDDAARNMRALVGQLNAGMIDADEFRKKLGDVIGDASDATDELSAIDTVGFSTVIAGLETLGRMLGFVEQKGRYTRAALPGTLPMDTGTPLSSDGIDGLLPPTTQVVTSSPRPERVPVGLAGIDWGAPSGGGKGKGGGGGGKRLSEEQREAARLFEQTRTKAEKYALEVEDLNKLLASGAISQDTYNRALDATKEKYGQAGNAGKFFEKTAEDLQEAFLDAAVDGINSFEQIERAIKRAALQALIFRTGPLAGLFGGGGTAGGWLAGIASALGFAKGGVFSGGIVQPFATGGVVASPTYFGMSGRLGLMGEAGPEAILPLARGAGGKLGVAMQGGGAMAISIGFDDSTGSFTAMVRDEAGRVVAQAAPSIVSQSAQAVSRAMSKTKSFGQR